MQYKTPLFDLNYGRPEEKAVTEVLQSKWISMGKETAAFESAFGEHLGTKNVVAVTNCTAALHLAMVVLGIKEGDEVIVPSFTFVATVNAVRYVRAKPVFVDIKGTDDLSIDPDDVMRKITARTKAIVVMHYAGFSADVDAIMKIARERKLYVVEDAAHAPDAEYNGKKLGTIGDIGCFSFFSNKNITCAEGGALTANSSGYARRARLLRSHGMTSISYERAKGHAVDYDVVELGYNYRLDDIRAALLLAQLKRLKKDVKRREALVQEYRRLLANVDEIEIPYKRHPYRSSYYIMPVILNPRQAKITRDEVRKRMQSNGIQTSVHYPPVHKFKSYADYACHLPRTEHAAMYEITLPLYFDLTFAKVRKIVKVLKNSIVM